MGGITTCGLLTQHPEIQVAASMMGTPAPMDYVALVSKTAKERGVFIPEDLPLLLSWIKYYDLSKKPEKLAKRPVLFWHGTEDEKIPYQEVAHFYQRIKEEPYAENSQFITAEKERHLIRGEVMDQVAQFFATQFHL